MSRRLYCRAPKNSFLSIPIFVRDRTLALPQIFVFYFDTVLLVLLRGGISHPLRPLRVGHWSCCTEEKRQPPREERGR